ncbi:hypothetical protein SSX86_024819 [Deinandra increscens subsp. villosa]|uniref:Ubiquitin-like protease family profile domain-containing protein n=1 Tax=Deinandra increscens subsp. villosa TaxID=3103831 RepID=A0AAP0GND1_9ASTR
MISAKTTCSGPVISPKKSSNREIPSTETTGALAHPETKNPDLHFQSPVLMFNHQIVYLPISFIIVFSNHQIVNVQPSSSGFQYLGSYGIWVSISWYLLPLPRIPTVGSGVQSSGDTKMVGASKLEDDEMMKKLDGTGISCLDVACDEAACDDVTIKGKISIGDDFVIDVPEGNRCADKKDRAKENEENCGDTVALDENAIACAGNGQIRNYGGRMNSDDRLAIFRQMMDNTLKAAGLKSLKGIDLVFIPYVFAGGYYLLCFKLSNPEIYLIDDNKNLDADHNNIYFGWPEMLRDVFAGYLKEKKHPRASRIKGSELNCLQMPWMDTDNYVDSGVYVMRHMETFEGTEVRQWKCLLSNEALPRQMELNDLRRKYVAKMVLHPMNTEKMRVEVEMRAYMDNDLNVRRAIRDAAFKKIKGMLKVLEKFEENKLR